MTTATSDTGTAFRLPAEDLAFIRAVSQRTGIPQSDIFREGGRPTPSKSQHPAAS